MLHISTVLCCDAESPNRKKQRPKWSPLTSHTTVLCSEPLRVPSLLTSEERKTCRDGSLDRYVGGVGGGSTFRRIERAAEH